MKIYDTEFKQQFLNDYLTMTIQEIIDKYKISSATIYKLLRVLNPDFPKNKFKQRKPRELKEYKVGRKKNKEEGNNPYTFSTTTLHEDDDGTVILESAHKYIIVSKKGVNLSDYINE